MIYDGGHLGRGAIKNIVEISTETTNIVNKHKHVDLSAGWADDSDSECWADVIYAGQQT